MIGRTIAHYRITSELGGGGMGNVYLATDLQQDKPVALKLMREEDRRDPHLRARFLHEAKSLARISHPSVVAHYEAGEADDVPYIAMEYLEGRSLEEYFKSAKRSHAEILDMMAAVADGVQAIHEAKIIHRDLKPSNIIIDDTGCPRIFDFGIAQLGGATKLTQIGDHLGTFAYMSPEQTQGLEVDARSDLFSLGIILYEAIAGRSPFAGDHPSAISYAIAHEEPHPLARYAANVSEGLQDVVTKALNKERGERYQTAAEFAADLRTLRQGLTVKVPKQKTKKDQVRPPRPLVIGGTVLLALILATAGYFGLRTCFVPPGIESIAVLPFENIGAADQQDFVDGLTAELTTKLSSIRGLSVISRTAILSMINAGKNVDDIAKALGIEYLLEGTVRWEPASPNSPSRLRVTTSLFATRDRSTLWSAAYDTLMFPAAIAIQTDIGERVTNALNVQLFPSERQDLGRVRTNNEEAYAAFLRGKSIYDLSKDSAVVAMAISHYRQAVELDPNFAAAHAMLARLYAKKIWWGIAVKDDDAELAKYHSERADKLDPKSWESQLARGYYYYWVERDFGRALSIFSEITSRESTPSEQLYEAHEALAYVLRRSGEFDDAVKHLQTALEEDPDWKVKSAVRLAERAWELGNTHLRLRQWTEAEKRLRTAIELDPLYHDPYISLAELQIHGYANADSAWAILRTAPTAIDPELLAEERVIANIARRDPVEAAKYLMIADDDTVYYNLLRAQIAQLSGKQTLARAYSDSAAMSLAVRLKNYPKIDYLHRYYGIALSELGRAEEAIREGKKALELRPPEKDGYFSGPSNIEALARIYATVGRKDEAVAMLDSLLSLRAGLVTTAYLRIAPEYDPLRGHPAFEALLAESR